MDDDDHGGDYDQEVFLNKVNRGGHFSNVRQVDDSDEEQDEGRRVQQVGVTLVSAAETFLSSTYTDMTDATVSNAIRKLVAQAQDHGWWSKCVWLYPMASDGTNKTRAAQHAYNLKDPSQYEITWNGSVTHSAAEGARAGAEKYGTENITKERRQRR